MGSDSSDLPDAAAGPLADPAKRSTLSRLGRYAAYTAPTLIVGASYISAQAQTPGSGGGGSPPPFVPPPFVPPP